MRGVGMCACLSPVRVNFSLFRLFSVWPVEGVSAVLERVFSRYEGRFRGTLVYRFFKNILGGSFSR